MDDLGFWRDIALVFLLIQLFVGVLLVVALSYLLVRLTNGLQGHAERAARKAQSVTHMVAEKTDEYSRKAVEPVVAARSQGARVSETVRTLLRRAPEPSRSQDISSNGSTDRTGMPS